MAGRLIRRGAELALKAGSIKEMEFCIKFAYDVEILDELSKSIEEMKSDDDKKGAPAATDRAPSAKRKGGVDNISKNLNSGSSGGSIFGGGSGGGGSGGGGGGGFDPLAAIQEGAQHYEQGKKIDGFGADSFTRK